MSAVTPPPRLRTTALAVGAMFAVNGFAFGSWVPRLPEIRDALDMGDAALGLTLLGGGIGGLTMSLAAGRIVDRVGSRTAMVSTSIALALLIPLIALAPSPPVLFGVLIAVGALDGVTDVAQNQQALDLQGLRSRSLLSRMHAAWSLGTLSGGVVASRAAAADVSFTLQLSVTAVVLAAVCLLAAPRLLPTGRPPSRTAALGVGHPAAGPALPPEAGVGEPAAGRAASGAARTPVRLLVLLFAVGVAAVLAEMPPTEWAALVLAQRFDLSTGTAGLGFVAFSAGMVLGRLSGDLVVDRVGSERTRRAGATLTVVGVAVVAVSPTVWVAVVGLSVAGAGVSPLFPMAVRRAGELLGGSSRGVAVFASGGRAGVLVGSPAMGAVSALSTRTVALVAIAGSAALVSAVIRLPSPRD